MPKSPAPKLYALLIALNEYHPDSGVGSLDGCINDVTAMQGFLKKNYKKLTPSVKVLKNEKATRMNIIKAFQSQLIKKAKPGDTVLFYYSGHGSYAKTAKEFEQFDGKDQDETLVCYDSRLKGNQDLADKEMAVLLSRIEEDVHTVLIVDACHSASITRSVADEYNFGKQRFTAQREKEKSRSLKKYMLDGDDYYGLMKKANKGKVTIPRSKHILLSACDRDQLANETGTNKKNAGGLFSARLMDALQQNRNITYTDLFSKVRHTIKLEARNQLPTMASLEGFNPNTVFLQKDVQKNNKRHAIRFINGSWRLDYGAIHGLPTDTKSIAKLQIGVFPDSKAKNQEKQLATVKVEKVLLKESVLKLDKADTSLSFSGEIQNMPTAMLVKLKGISKNVKAFEKRYQKDPSPFLSLDTKVKNAKYTLVVDKNKLFVLFSADGALLHGVKGIGSASVNYIKETLEQIESWERLSNLENKKTKISKAVEVVFVDESEEDDPVETKDKVITFDYPKRGEDLDEDNNPVGLFYTIKARNKSKKKLHVALLHLNASFGVSTFFPCGEIPAGSDWIVLDNEHGLLIENSKWNEVTDVFKVIVSTEAFDDYKFQQKSFERGVIAQIGKDLGTRGATLRRKKEESDWCTHTITVNTIRKEQSISDKDVSFTKEKIKIKGHKTFKADVAFAPVRSGTRSVHPSAALADVFNSNEFGLINLVGSNTRSVQDKTIIELSGIGNEKVLKKQPLEIQVNQKLAENENIIPVTFDGEFIIPFGNTTKGKDGSTNISISELPVSKDVHRKRSVKKAIWFCLLKVVGLRDKAFRLQRAQINGKGELVRHKGALQAKVDEAKKILIVVHGIIGDTKDMAQKLMFLVDPNDEQKHDLMLTFDYENLNEPIEKIAAEFNKQLGKLGLKPGDGRQIDIIAHSMGGLVSRYMVEHVRKGDNLVNRLFMLGTPNGGSPFGSIPEYINLFNKLVTMAINFGKPFLAPLVLYLEGLQKANKLLGASSFITVTLNQMSATSKFTKDLYGKNKAKPATQYYVIAGDITKYLSKADKPFGRFVDKVMLGTGNFMSKSLPNDIAATVDQIQGIPPKFKTKKFTVVGHHMNYFEEGEAMVILGREV